MLGDVEFLTVKEVAELLRVGKSTVYDWVDRGDLPAMDFNVKRGGNRNVRITKAALQEFLKRCTLQPVEPKPRYKH